MYLSYLPGVKGSVNDKERCSHGRDDILREETLPKMNKEHISVAP